MYPLGRQDLTQQGAGKSWVGVLPSSDLRSRVGNGGRGSHPAGWGRRLKVGDSAGGSKDRVEPVQSRTELSPLVEKLLFALHCPQVRP